jgi:hypothetical protein
MAPAVPLPSDSTDLCTSCGLCCSGVVYDSVPCRPAEKQNVADLGLRPYEDPPGQPRFDLPCRHLQGTRCGVYGRRPSPCAEFQCELLKQFEAGEVSKPEALALVYEAKRMIGEVQPMMSPTDGPITPKHWGRLLEQWRFNARAGAVPLISAEVVLHLAKLNRFLDAHFRNKEQQVVLPRD